MYEFETRAISPDDEARAQAILTQMERMRPATFAHSHRVADLAILVGQRAHLPEAQMHAMYWGALLHDVGEMHIRRTVLERPGGLAPSEISQVREHTIVGSRWLAAVPGLALLEPFARWHHERFDGEGYPDARASRDVPLGVALVAVCDAWDALTEDRPHREPRTFEEAASELQMHSGRQWSRTLVEWTLDCVHQQHRARLR